MRAPILRFKEFTDDWEGTTLENLAEVERGKFSVRPRNDPRYFGGEMPFVQTGDVAGSDMYLKGYSQTLNADGIKVSRVFPADTILITIAANIGDTTITQYAVACPDSVVAIQAKKDLANTIFLKNLIDLQKENLDSQATQNAQKNINLQVLKPLQLIAPSKAEQTKIATFLSAVDEKISQLSQKLHLLGQYKQGMMQKLFSQQIRFKADDGSEFGEWDEYSLDTLLSKIIDNRGKTPVTEANLEIPLIEVNAIGQRRIKYEKVSKYFSEDTFQNWFRAYLEHQDILFSTVGNTAICSIYTDEIKAGIAQNIVGLRANIKLIQPTFLYYLLTEISNNQKFKSIEMQAVQPSIKVSQMIHLTFLTPCLEEQSKIANFLSSIDQKIEVVAQQIEQAKLWKKGLLQQMFV